MLRVDLEFLALFEQPKSMWDAHKEIKKSYSNCHVLTKQLVELGLLEEIQGQRSRRNPKIIKRMFILSEKGRQLLKLFRDLNYDVKLGA